MTIFVSTHFMNEAARCDRISLMNDGRVLATDAPQALVQARGVATLEQAFISYLEEANGPSAPQPGGRNIDAIEPEPGPTQHQAARRGKNPVSFSFRRMLAYTARAKHSNSCVIRSGCRLLCLAQHFSC